MPTTVRQRVLDYIRTHRLATASEIGQALHLTAANVRHHLGILYQQGSIEIAGERPAQGKGRPAQLYAIAQGLQGDNLAYLAGALLDELNDRLVEPERQAMLLRMAQRLAQRTAHNQPGEAAQRKSGPHLTRRLVNVVQDLNHFHYQARWEAHRDAPRIILAHCPYAAILPEHPEICRLDATLIETLLGVPVEQISRLARDERGATYCMFKIR